jgi:hypothetical protein
MQANALELSWAHAQVPAHATDCGEGTVWANDLILEFRWKRWSLKAAELRQRCHMATASTLTLELKMRWRRTPQRELRTALRFTPTRKPSIRDQTIPVAVEQQRRARWRRRAGRTAGR